jgi:hypothetical protein
MSALVKGGAAVALRLKALDDTRKPHDFALRFSFSFLTTEQRTHGTEKTYQILVMMLANVVMSISP